jgi:anti-sigma B factor antagonist
VSAAEPLSVEHHGVEGEHRLVATGELDISTVGLLEAPFDAAVAAEATTIVVDLGGVTFIDSTGLRLLIRMTEKCANGQLAIVSTPIIDRLVEITGLRDQLPLRPGSV